MQITFCEPSQSRQNLSFDRVQFASKIQYPVEAHYGRLPDGSLGFISTGLSFDDYSRCQTTRTCSRIGGTRHIPTPEYALNEVLLRKVCIRYMEIRCGIQSAQPGTYESRLVLASERLRLRTEKAIIVLDSLCKEYVACTDPDRRYRLGIQIEGYDSTIRLNREIWVVPAIVRAYYLEQLDSVGVAARFGYKSPFVRQILFRLSKLARKIESGTDVVTARDTAKNKEERDRRRRDGICTHCGKNPARDGRCYCQPCAKKRGK
jgi:hypothetical protein